MVNLRKASEVTESVKVARCHNHIHLTTELALFRLAQIRNAVDVLYEYPTLTDGTPDARAVIAVTIGDERELGEATIILVSLRQVTAIVLSEVVPSAVRLANVGKRIRMRIPHCACVGERVVHGTIHVPEETLGVLTFDKDGVHGHINARLLVEEAISDTDLIDTGVHRPHPYHGTCHT